MITSVGFPIAMCLVMMWYIKDQNERHDEESKKFAEAINNNSLIIQKICDKIESLVKGGS